jgi:hypothetical protein
MQLELEKAKNDREAKLIQIKIESEERRLLARLQDASDEK